MGNEVPVEETDNAEAVLREKVRVHAETGRCAVCVWGGAEQWFRVRRGEGLSGGARTLSFKQQEPVRIYKRRRELIIYVVLEDQLVQ